MSPAMRFRRSVFSVLAVVCVTYAMPIEAQSSGAEDVQEVRAAAEHFLRVFANMDWEPFRATWASEPTLFAQDPEYAERVTGKEAVEARFQRFFIDTRSAGGSPPFLRINPRDLLVQRYGDAAIVTFNLGVAPTIGRRTFVFVKENGEWKLAHMHASNTVSP